MVTVRLARWSWLLLVLCGMAAVAHAENNNCGDPPDPSHYIAQSGDTEDAQHFAVDRTFTGQGKLEFNMCSGELRIERGHGDKLRLHIETRGTPSLKMRAYVKTLDVAADHATISLQFPYKAHVVVVLELPSSGSLKSEINLGAGKFYFDIDGGKGEGSLQVNVGAGSLDIDRENGETI